MKFTPETYSFKRLLVNYKFEVPFYQREYSWEDQQIEELLDDISYCIEHKTEHFMGVIIATKENEEDIILKLVDGQQRIATFCLLLAALRDIFAELGDFKQARKIQEKLRSEDEYGDEKYYPLITLTAWNNKYMDKIVLSFPDLENVENKQEELSKCIKEKKKEEKELKKYHSNKLLSKAYSRISKHIHTAINDFSTKKDKLEFLKNYLRTIYDKLIFVLTIADTIENAYTIFETLNDRGIKLSLSDLLKNYIFSKAESEHKLKEVRDLWNELMLEIELEELSDFLYYYWASSVQKITARNLYKSIKSYLNDKQIKALDFTRELLNEAKNFNRIRSPENDYWTNSRKDKEIKRLIAELSILNIKQCYPLLISVMKVCPKDVRKYLETIVNFSFRYNTICGKNPRVVEKLYSNLAISFRKEKKCNFEMFLNAIKEYYPQDTEFIESFAEKKLSNKRIIKYIFTKINDKLLQSNERNQEISVSDTITIEHILPQNINNTSWQKIFPETEEHKEYVNMIGNLTLLGEEYNKAAQNWDFKRKKEKIYAYSNIPTTYSLCDYAEWNASHIKKRGGDLAKLANKIWSINFNN